LKKLLFIGGAEKRKVTPIGGAEKERIVTPIGGAEKKEKSPPIPPEGGLNIGSGTWGLE
jgi:hypothetical protein